MSNKEAIVLAGGLGTRMQGVLHDVPKCMALVKGVPFLTYVLLYLEKQSISKVILSVGYLKDQIINNYGSNFKSMVIEYAVETEPLGTGGAVKNAFDLCSLDECFVINGDTYFVPDLVEMENLHQHMNSTVTIATKHVDNSGRYGLVLTDQNGRITEFREKDPVSGNGWINGGIYLINKHSLAGKPMKFSLEKDFLAISCAAIPMFSYQTEAFFLDMGIPEDYTRAQTLLPSLIEI